MATLTKEEARERYIRERPLYGDVADYVAKEIRRVAARRQLTCHVTGRAKEVSSFVKKIITQELNDPWKEVYDKAGVRIVVQHSGVLDQAFRLVKDTFHPVYILDDRNDNDNEDRLRYPRLHVQVEVPRVALVGSDQQAEDLQCEIQIRTEAADLWSRMSHSLLYKPTTELPRTVRRSLYGLLALLEVHDREVERAVTEMAKQPDHELNLLIRQTERVFFTFCTEEYSTELTRMVTEVLLSTVSEPDRGRYCEDLAGFADIHRDRLEKIYRDYGPHSKSGMAGYFVLVGQPESVSIFERLESAALLLEAKWAEYDMPEEWLIEMKSIWG